MKGRTSIIIAHRLATIRSADNILVLNNGVIAEQGTHKELLEVEKGIYKNLSNLQFSEY
jgi:ABC-type multidrug transport system fused ATPase/permease subunit